MGWLVHSVPRWAQPPAPGPLVLPAIDAPQTKLSQSFLFVLLPRGQLPAVFAQLRHMQVGFAGTLGLAVQALGRECSWWHLCAGYTAGSCVIMCHCNRTGPCGA